MGNGAHAANRALGSIASFLQRKAAMRKRKPKAKDSHSRIAKLNRLRCAECRKREKTPVTRKGLKWLAEAPQRSSGGAPTDDTYGELLWSVISCRPTATRLRVKSPSKIPLWT